LNSESAVPFNAVLQVNLAFLNIWLATPVSIVIFNVIVPETQFQCLDCIS